MFDDDQETPNLLTASYEFNMPDGKKKLMEFEVRPWMTNHEAEMGAGGYGSSNLPPAGLTPAPPPAPAKVELSSNGTILGPASGKPGTIGNLFYGSKGYLGIQEYDSYKTWMGEKG